MKNKINYLYILITVLCFMIFLSLIGIVLYFIMTNNIARIIFFISIGIFFIIASYETVKELINDYRREIWKK
jgi:hypothetical protein